MLILQYLDIISALIVNACCVLQNMAQFYNVQQPEIYFDELHEEEIDNRIYADDARNINGNRTYYRIILQLKRLENRPSYK